MIRGLGEDAEFRIRHEFILFLAYHFGSSFFSYLGAGWPSLLRSKYLYFFIPIGFSCYKKCGAEVCSFTRFHYTYLVLFVLHSLSSVCFLLFLLFFVFLPYAFLL